MTTHRKSTYRKSTPSAAAAQWEAVGLRWLAVPGGAPVVHVEAVDDTGLTLEELRSASPTAAAAEEFGRLLAVTHAASAPAFGAGPDGWDGDGFQGPVDDLLPLPLQPYDTWGAMYADLRLEPLLDRAQRGRPAFGPDDEARLRRVVDRLRAGDFDTGEHPARVHGDLWSGNLMWTPQGCVLIDPMAHASHREVDLAALALFGAPQLPRILAAYDEAAPLADGWRDRVPLMHLHLVLLHVVLFGGGYARQAVEAARRYA